MNDHHLGGTGLSDENGIRPLHESPKHTRVNPFLLSATMLEIGFLIGCWYMRYKFGH